jgi:hypothetical protein
MKNVKISKEEAMNLAINEGIDFALSPFQISISDKTYLSELAKRCGYKKSKTSPFSTGSAFFVHLQKMYTRK